jgi:NADPH-dependent 7-cyano-7-deazaguanine reductase QueF-like protein
VDVPTYQYRCSECGKSVERTETINATRQLLLGQYVAFVDTEDNRVSMLQPIPRKCPKPDLAVASWALLNWGMTFLLTFMKVRNWH